jgi:Dolichyl-phosphate-mannose-protein mannosyltransferase
MRLYGATILAAVKRQWWVLFALFSLALLLTTAARAKGKPFWHDEIYTILVSQSPSLDHIRRGLIDGLDLQPPLNTLLTRVVHSVAGVGPIATRLVPILAFWGATFFIFSIARTRASVTVAFAAVLLLCMTAAFRYAFEARGYALLLCCFSAAVWAWMEAAAGRRRRLNLVVLATALAAGMWTHYFAIVAFAPVLTGEAIRLWKNKRVDWGVVGAIAAAAIASVPMALLARTASKHASTFWSRASISDIRPTYEFLLNGALDRRVLTAAAIGVGLSWLVSRFLSRTGAQIRIPAHELAAGIVCALVPIVAILIGVLVTGVFSDHYAMPGTAGLSLAIPATMWMLGRKSSLAVVPLVVVLFMRFAAGVIAVPWPGKIQAPSPIADRPLLMRALEDPTAPPLAITGGLLFLQIWYYSPPEAREHLTFLADGDEAIAHGRPDTIDRGLATLGKWTPVRVDDYHSFLQTHPQFRVYSAGSGWLLPELQQAGAVLQPGERELGAILYSVERGRAR